MKSKIRPKPVVGQVVYQLSRITNTKANMHEPRRLIPNVVKFVGRKYFCCSLPDSQNYSEYHLDDWSEKTQGSISTYLYESVQEYEDEKEHSTLLREVREAFRGYSTESLSLEQLRAIKQIISPEGD